MSVLVDVHTHNRKTLHPFSVLNVSIDLFLENDDNVLKKFLSVGIHPWDIHTTDTSAIQILEKIAGYKNVVAIGECGLDKNCTACIKEQGYFFERQVQISEKVKKPLIIHCVAAYNEIIQLNKKLQPQQNWIIHGFRGKPQLALQLLNAGFYLSYGENFNSESIVVTPFDRLCVETDESNLDIETIYKKIALVKKCHPEELNAGCMALKQYVC
jgi:TatD DNase family protein